MYGWRSVAESWGSVNSLDWRSVSKTWTSMDGVDSGSDMSNSTEWGSVDSLDSWGIVSNWSVGNSDWGLGNSNGWTLTINNSIESIDGISSVGNGTDGTIGLNKGVLSLDDITVTGFVGGMLVSGEGVRDGVSVVVLWVRVEWFSTDWSGNGMSNWGGNGVSNWSSMDSLYSWSVTHWGSYSVGDRCNSSHGMNGWSSITGISWGSISLSVSWGSVGLSVSWSSISNWSTGTGNSHQR